MLALTLIQPMGWAIVKGWKPYENRTRDMRRLEMRGVRTRVAIHNGAKYDDDYAQLVHYITGVVPEQTPPGIIGVATFTGRVFTRNSELPDDKRRIWFSGPVAFEIDTAESIAFDDVLLCNGALGFWSVPPTLLREIADRIEVTP